MANVGGVTNGQRPRLDYLHHMSLPCRDVEESKRFYTQFLGGELFHDIAGFAEVRIANIIIGMSEQSGGWTGPNVEYPHYGLNVDGENFALARRWFDACGVPQYGWTRNYKTALLYFRDPSGNLLELYCETGYDGIRDLALGPRQGGTALPLEALHHRWNGKVGNTAERPRIHSFSHLSMPVHDLEQSKRFYIEVMGGEPMTTSEPETFTEVRVAGTVIGLSTRGGSPTARESEFPHYAFHVDAENFLPMIDWLKSHGVVAPGPWTRDGKKALMYFRDPSGNLFEIYCGGNFPAAASFPRGIKQGGSYTTNFANLYYEWDGAA